MWPLQHDQPVLPRVRGFKIWLAKRFNLNHFSEIIGFVSENAVPHPTGYFYSCDLDATNGCIVADDGQLHNMGVQGLSATMVPVVALLPLPVRKDFFVMHGAANAHACVTAPAEYAASHARTDAGRADVLWQLDSPSGDSCLLRFESAGTKRMLHMLAPHDMLPRRALQESLLRGMAHDYGNAIASIMGFAEIATLHSGGGTPMLEKSLASILKGCDLAMKGLEWAHAVAGRIELRYGQHDVTDKVRQWCAEEAERAGCGAAMVHVSVEATAAASHWSFDEVRLKTAFLEILRNAMAASSRKEDVSVLIALDGASLRRAGTWLCIAVLDAGKGMDETCMARLGDAYRVCSGGREGRGRGFALARGLVHAHAGQVDVVSCLGFGSAVCIVLPHREEAAPV